ncbi:MAG: hypothetical protein LBP79_05835 [Clostridiales bacterium]|jgi:hypothetical protein|nr:hypothetical protein [Clostridiales bacterium]
MGKFKKKGTAIIIFSVIAAATVTAAIVLAGLGKDVDLTGSVSYADEYVYFGRGKNFSVTVCAGIAEKTFLTDGKATDVAEFCKVTLNILNSAYLKITEFECGVDSGGIYAQGKIEKNPVTLEHTAQIAVADASKIKSVYVKYTNAKSESIAVENLLQGRLSSRDAFDAALKIFAKEIKENIKNRALKREIYIKFVTGYGGEEPYYWYVAFIAGDSDFWAVLIDAKTGEADAKRT